MTTPKQHLLHPLTQRLLLFTVIFLYLGLWALVKPPFQAPDEFAHFVKALSFPEAPWATPIRNLGVRDKYLAPLVDFPLLHQIPFHPERKFTAEQIEKMQNMTWPEHVTDEVKLRDSSAHSYPAIYYAALFISGESLTKLFRLTPYQRHYVYRLLSCALAAMLWVLVFAAMGSLPHRFELLMLTVLNPMLGFISSAINPDALIFPLCSLAMIYSYQVLVYDRKLWKAFTSVVLACLVKPAGLILIPCIACVAVLSAFFRRKNVAFTAFALRSALLTVGVWLIVHFGFYYWSPPTMTGAPRPMLLQEYILALGPRLDGFFHMYWASFGWLDYGLPRAFYTATLVFVVLHLVSLAGYWRRLEQRQYILFMLAFALLYCGGVLAGEFHFISKVGYTIQGRYFIPVALGFSFMTLHPLRWLRSLSLLFLLLMNAVAIWETTVRYYGDNWELALTILPF